MTYVIVVHFKVSSTLHFLLTCRLIEFYVYCWEFSSRFLWESGKVYNMPSHEIVFNYNLNEMLDDFCTIYSVDSTVVDMHTALWKILIFNFFNNTSDTQAQLNK